jgi:stage II sporulation protein P
MARRQRSKITSFTLIVLLIGIVFCLGFERQTDALAATETEPVSQTAADKQELPKASPLGQLLAKACTDIINYETEEPEKPLSSLVLAQILPWDFSDAETETEEKPETVAENQSTVKYTSGDETSFYWNRITEAQAALTPMVGIYCTHSAETYTPFASQPKVTGSRGGVYVAASVIADSLAQKGIGTVVDDTIHDYPDWSSSYANSKTTASRLLAENPELKVLIDLHRDAGVPKENSTCTINGKQSARIMLVVGSNTRQEHPNWQQNKAFAEKIGAKMEEMYPGLLRTVKVQDGRYNQHLATNAILVEMGATENTIEEVEYASELLAEVLYAIINEG